MADNDSDTMLLDANVETHPERFEHPDTLTPEEVADGLRLWESIDDLDDLSNGVLDVRESGLLTASPGFAEAMRRANIVRVCLLEAGVPEVSIELLNGRPDSGDTWNLCRPVSVISHHIASTPTVANPTPGLALVKVGRSDLPGPLANGTAGVDLVYRILTLGMANHPGYGGPWPVSGPLGSYTIPKDVARPYAWGTEYEGGYGDAVWDATYTNKRTGKSMTYREFMGRANAGLTRAIWLINGKGKSPGGPGEMDLSGYHGEHKTWAPGRKPDRLNYSTESGRAEIQRYSQEDEVTAKEVWDFKIKPAIEGAIELPARVMLAQAHNRALDARKGAWAASVNAEKALAVAEGNRKALRALTKDVKHLPDDVRKALDAADEQPVVADDAPPFEESDDA